MWICMCNWWETLLVSVNEFIRSYRKPEETWLSHLTFELWIIWSFIICSLLCPQIVNYHFKWNWTKITLLSNKVNFTVCRQQKLWRLMVKVLVKYLHIREAWLWVYSEYQRICKQCSFCLFALVLRTLTACIKQLHIVFSYCFKTSWFWNC